MARGDVGAPLPLTGRYAVQGAQVRAGLELWARHTGARLVLLDDCSDPREAARLHEDLVAGGCRFVLGPYGSDSTRAVARARAGRVVWNHGAAADDVQRLPGVVSAPSPASRYLVGLGRAVAPLSPGARIAVEAAPGRFARFACEELQREAAVQRSLPHRRALCRARSHEPARRRAPSPHDHILRQLRARPGRPPGRASPLGRSVARGPPRASPRRRRLADAPTHVVNG
jgi:hypothetical protein